MSHRDTHGERRCRRGDARGVRSPPPRRQGGRGAADGRLVVSLRKALVAKMDPVTIGGAIAGVAAVGSVTYIAIKERWGSTPAASPAPADAAAQPAAGAKSGDADGSRCGLRELRPGGDVAQPSRPCRRAGGAVSSDHPPHHHAAMTPPTRGCTPAEGEETVEGCRALTFGVFPAKAMCHGALAGHGAPGRGSFV